MPDNPRFDFSQVPDVILLDLCALAVKKARDRENQKGATK